VPLLELAPPQQVDGVVMGDAQQPGQQTPAAGLIGMRLAPQLEEGFLDHLFRGGRVAQQLQRHRIHAAAVTVVHQFQGARVGLAERSDQGSFVGLVPLSAGAHRRDGATTT
jgi:hypothetical protein